MARKLLPFSLVAACAVSTSAIFFTACGGTSSSTPASKAVADGAVDEARGDASEPPDGANPVDSSSGVLRGAFVNPDSADGGYRGGSEAQVEALEAQVGHLDLELDYHPFAAPFPTTDEQAALDHGRIPVVSLGCGDTMQNIADGQQDTKLKALAGAMKASGKPVVLRWFWEMNLVKTANGRGACFDAAYDGKGTQAPDYFDPAHYIAAWQHIHTVVAEEGAANVRMFFCGSGGEGGFAKYYPGDAYVEINGFDVYDRKSVGFKATIAAPYAEAKMASAVRPIWVGETGATAQLGYLDGQTKAMLAANAPLVGGVIYFDSFGPAANWSFNADGIAGFKAFGN